MPAVELASCDRIAGVTSLVRDARAGRHGRPVPAQHGRDRAIRALSEARPSHREMDADLWFLTPATSRGFSLVGRRTRSRWAGSPERGRGPRAGASPPLAGKICPSVREKNTLYTKGRGTRGEASQRAHFRGRRGGETPARGSPRSRCSEPGADHLLSGLARTVARARVPHRWQRAVAMR